MAHLMKTCVFFLLVGILFCHASANKLRKDIDVDGAACQGEDCVVRRDSRKLLSLAQHDVNTIQSDGGNEDNNGLKFDKEITWNYGRKLSGDSEDSDIPEDDDDDDARPTIVYTT